MCDECGGDVDEKGSALEAEPDRVRISSLKPLDAQVVLLRVKNDRSEGGIIIPDQALDRASTFWRVLAVGPGRLVQGAECRREPSNDYTADRVVPRIPVAVQVGDLVAMIPGAHLKGGEIDLTDDEGVRQRVLVIHEDAIVAVVS